jgi:hypothetical protein
MPPDFGCLKGAPGKTVSEIHNWFVLNWQVSVSASGLRFCTGCTYNFEGSGIFSGMRRGDWPACQGAAGLFQWAQLT